MSAPRPAVSPHTAEQIDALILDPDVPLLLCDVDEVVVHFLQGLEAWLDANGLWLDPASFALNGNIRHKHSNLPLADHKVGPALLRFFSDRTHELAAIDGAADALDALSRTMQVVMLTNIPGQYQAARRRNLAGHGIHYPIVTNSGPKGPAVAAIAQSHRAPVVFIDDHLGYLSSAREHHGDVHLVHFMQDERFGRHVAAAEYVSLRTDNWADARRHIETLIDGWPRR